MKRIISLAAAAALAFGMVPVTASAVSANSTPSSSVEAAVATASPRPGQFCKKADRGKVVNSSYGKLKCKADPNNSRYSRWYRV